MNDPGAFIVDGLILEGTAWDAENEKLVLNDRQAVRLDASHIRWVQDDSSEEQPADLVTLPVYLNNDRSDVMFTLDLPFDKHSGCPKARSFPLERHNKQRKAILVQSTTMIF
ncbi:hypothetical protein EV424DRAFT_1342694 [Suillus variegatus]|nr:hypothetical protein EV424DRAFT_1342694 [Suillus variegatus]